jgi:DNA-directed RNA polymerase
MKTTKIVYWVSTSIICLFALSAVQMNSEMAIEGSELVYGSIEEIVSGASKAMNWLRSIPKIKKECVSWLTPIGFPVYQPYVKGKTVNIRTSFGGDTIAIRVLDYDKETTHNLLLQKNGMAPNFVHSLDATHQVITILDSDLDAYTMIHDDYGTYACDVPKLKECIRQSFYKLYSNHKPLEELAEQLGIECNLEYGNYQLEEILESEYFFD